MADLEKIQKKLKHKLKKERYQHTLGVMYTAGSLAMRYGENLEEALSAGLLHDCGKYPSIEKQLRQCQKYEIRLERAEAEVHALIHAKLGACLAEKKYGIDNPRILDITPPDGLICPCWKRSSTWPIILSRGGR